MKTLTWQKPGQQNVAQELIKIIINYVAELRYYKERLPVYFQYVNLFGFEQEGILIGFMGIAEGNLEMLFIDNKYRGAGIGKKLITYAIDNLQVTKVDVNEQNVQAVGFYEYMGFNIYKRSNLDGEGKEYPILHMQL